MRKFDLQKSMHIRSDPSLLHMGTTLDEEGDCDGAKIASEFSKEARLLQSEKFNLSQHGIKPTLLDLQAKILPRNCKSQLLCQHS